MARRSYRVDALALGVVAAIVAFFGVRALLGPDPSVLDSAPNEIVGTWTTTDPRYADRAFVIRPNELRLRTAADETAPYRVSLIRRVPEADHVLFEVTYHTSEGQSTQAFRLLSDGTVRLKNPDDVVWTRAETPSGDTAERG